MKTIQHADLDAILIANDSPHDPDDLPGDLSRYYLSEMRDQTRAVLMQFGMTWDNDCIYLHDDWSIAGIRAYTTYVDASYENAVPDANNMMTWGPLLDFGGDDDLDYNSSYIDIVLEAIEEYLK